MRVYDDALASGWQDWSWSGSYDFAATDTVADGAASVLAVAKPYGALSLHAPEAFRSAALRLWVEGDAPSLILEADDEGYATDPLDLSTLADIRAGEWVQVTIDLSPFGAHDWTRLDLFDNSSVSARFHVDRIELLDELPTVEGFTGVEAIGAATLVLYGSGDASGAVVTFAGATVGAHVTATVEDPARVLLALDAPITGDGTLSVTLGESAWSIPMRRASATVATGTPLPISPSIYGMAFPPDATYIAEHGVTVARWGGNATSLYNPAGDHTNLAFDWYFENYSSQAASAWVADMAAAGTEPFLSVPALDWVAKDDTSCAYSVAKYGAQTATDRWRPDCGSGFQMDGTPITWNDPADAATPWTAADLGEWLGALGVAPTYVAIDNELDIGSSTHQDVHPDPVTYDELFERWTEHADAVRAALPEATIVGPSSCCWWFYWNSAAGESDKAAHAGEDFLPWWLDEVRAHDEALGQRTLDMFDVHYYPDGEFNDDADDATRARRLRSTRGLWDPTYTDEGWIGTDEWATTAQPDRNRVQLLPRMRALADAHYPGTQLALTEWNWGAEADISGGLAVADVLGILGREGVDLATYWTAPAAGTPAASAFQLYTDPALPFGDQGLPVTFADPDHLGVYAARSDGRTTLVVVNKDPDHALTLALDGWFEPGDTLTVRHFSSQASSQVVTDPGGAFSGTLLVPAYGAVLVTTAGGGDTGGGDSGGGDTGGGTGGGDTAPHGAGEADKPGGCGCGGEGRTALAPLLGTLGLLATRRRARSTGRAG